VRPANRDSGAGSAGGGASSGLVGGLPGSGDVLVRGGGGGVSMAEGQYAAWRGSLPDNPNALRVMRMLTNSHSRILMSNVFT
jgi:hypothetical protein